MNQYDTTHLNKSLLNTSRGLRGRFMNIGRFAKLLAFSLSAVFLMGIGPSRALAQQDHTNMNMFLESDQASTPSDQMNTLIKAVRDATERYKEVTVAEAAGYSLQFGCVSGPDSGAMGMHFVNGAFVNDGLLDVTRPEIVIYEPQPDGHLRLIGADYLVLADTWNAAHAGNPPQLMGQLFHLFDSPNRFGLPAFYSLHVWAWKASPTGPFVNWHANVSCKAYNGQLH
jgi:hypothetical protein